MAIVDTHNAAQKAMSIGAEPAETEASQRFRSQVRDALGEHCHLMVGMDKDINYVYVPSHRNNKMEWRKSRQ
jgi:hypothetical protein